MLFETELAIYPLEFSEECGFLYMKILYFIKNTSKVIRKELRNEYNYKNYKGIIIDLRDNLGGSLEEALKSADLFLNTGVLSILKNNRDNNIEIHEAHKKNTLINQNTPVILIINSHTASAAEVFTSALTDNNRAKSVGEKTYGKGAVQTTIPLQTQNAAIKITTAYLYTPMSQSLDKIGLVPTIYCSIDDIDPKNIKKMCNSYKKSLYLTDNQINLAVNILEDSMK